MPPVRAIPRSYSFAPRRHSNFLKNCRPPGDMAICPRLAHACDTFGGRTTTARICPMSVRGERSWEFHGIDVYSREGSRLFAQGKASPPRTLIGKGRHAVRRLEGNARRQPGRGGANFEWQCLSDAPQRRVHEMGQYSVQWALPAPYPAPIKGNAHASREEILNFDRNPKEIGRWNDTQQ